MRRGIVIGLVIIAVAIVAVLVPLTQTRHDDELLTPTRAAGIAGMALAQWGGLATGEQARFVRMQMVGRVHCPYSTDGIVQMVTARATRPTRETVGEGVLATLLNAGC